MIKQRYELRDQQPIEQESSSRENTIQIRVSSNDPEFSLTWQSYRERHSLILKVRAASPKQWTEILSKWPNDQVRSQVLKSGVTQMKNQSLLVGKITNGRIHGFALLISKSGGFYQGELQSNCKHGIGYEALSKGIYLGMYINNKFEGHGTFMTFANEQYKGQYVGGMRYGYGAFKSPTETYIGQWRNDKPEGTGTFENQTSTYEGEVKEGVKHGQGKQFFKNGDQYTGSYINGRPEGYGQYIWRKNGAIFKGEFKNGLRHGKGVWTSNGDKFQGMYLNDKKSGYGEFIWASGNYYTGQYYNDLRHGQGRMNWNDGSWYQGQWKYGIQHGDGQLCQADQTTRKGYFENNTLVKQRDSAPKKYKIKILHEAKKTDSQTSIKFPCLQKEKQRKNSLPSVKKMTSFKRMMTQCVITDKYSKPNKTDWRKSNKTEKSHSQSNPKKSRAKSDQTATNLIQWSKMYNFKARLSQHQIN